MIRFLLVALCAGATAFGGQTEYLFLVTGDGIRHQEVFTGLDPALVEATEAAKKASGIENLPELRKQFWADSEKERREKLMPFFWKELAKQGVIYGNRALGSKVDCRNLHWFSYPGYAEILNGGPVAGVDSNDAKFSPQETVLEYFRRELNLPRNLVAAFGSWRIFNWITMQKDDAIFCNAGYEAMPPDLSPGKSKMWSELQFEILSPWDTVRHDAITLGLALDYIATQKPKVVYLALGETDDWAHDRRYDRTVQTLAYFDEALRRLWTLIQSTEPYRGKSTLIVTTDHGRGRTLEDWTSHGEKIPGAGESWLAIFGPDVPKTGEMKNTPDYSPGNIAATMLTLLGLDPKKYSPKAEPAVAEVLKK